MPTKQQVINSIAGIATNGANTARKVRDVLTEIVEFASQTTPSQPAANNLIAFSQEGSTSDKNKSCVVKYSIRGIQKQSVNFTFQIAFKPNIDVLRLEFPLPADLFDHLATVINQNNNLINFSVPLQKSVENNVIFHTIRMGIGITKDKQLLLDFSNPNDRLKPAKNDFIYSSVQFHSPFKD